MLEKNPGGNYYLNLLFLSLWKDNVKVKNHFHFILQPMLGF